MTEAAIAALLVIGVLFVASELRRQGLRKEILKKLEEFRNER